jgi:D-alanine-D-alanine ligase-like ATP-grasp enzyme
MKSEGVRLILDRTQLDLTNLPEWIFEKYIEGTEYRALVLQSDVIGMQRKKLDPNQKHPWRKHITVLEKGEWNDELVELSMKIASRLHMGFLAVDVLVDAAGKTYVLELNSMPGLIVKLLSR